MSNTCGEIRFMEGGTIKDATILSSSVVNSSISSSVLDSSSITNLSSIDSASARVIMQAIAALSPADLQVLIQALLDAMVAAGGVTTVPTCPISSVPASYLGGDDYFLGKPDGWLPVSNGAIPVYTPGCPDTITPAPIGPVIAH